MEEENRDGFKLTRSDDMQPQDKRPRLAMTSDAVVVQQLENTHKEVRGKNITQLPVSALRGVDDEKAELIKKTLGAGTIGEIATCDLVARAQQLQRVALRHPLEDAGLFDTRAPHAGALSLQREHDEQEQPLAESICLGEDERLRADPEAEPFDAICFLTLVQPNGRRARGTGFYAEFPDGQVAIVTAGHCLYEKGKYMSNIVVARARNGEKAPFGMDTFKTTELRVPEKWRDGYSQVHDYGLILIDQSSLPDVKPFKLDVLDDDTLNKANISTAGYPADKPGFHMWMDKGPVKSLKEGKIFYYEDTYGGQSGSPVWLRRDNLPICVGIHAYGSCPNSATRITDKVLGQMQTWIQEK